MYEGPQAISPLKEYCYSVIYLTTSHNDRDLLRHFNGLAISVPIPHGDAIFDGYGEGSRKIQICGERKKLPDLLQCLDDGRHLNQVRSAIEAGFDFYFLVVEDTWREKRNGNVEYFRSGKSRGWRDSGVSFYRVDSYLNELHYHMGVQVKYATTAKQTARVITDLYWLFQESPEDHDSLKKFYTPNLSPVLLRKPSLVRRVAKELMGVGWERSLVVEGRFKTVKEMVGAGVEEWVQLDGIGRNIAHSVVKELGGGG